MTQLVPMKYLLSNPWRQIGHFYTNLPYLQGANMNNSTRDAEQSPYYDRETLYREVWKEPMIHVAKRHVPKPGLGHWAKRAHGHETEQPPLLEFVDPPEILRRRARPQINRIRNPLRNAWHRKLSNKLQSYQNLRTTRR
jgi:hypothetical protein